MFVGILTAILLFHGVLTAEENPPIKIGAGFSLTGGEKELGLPASRGVKLALKEINSSGGVLGRHIELRLYDTEYNDESTRRLAVKWVQQDNVAAAIGFCDPRSVVAAGAIIKMAKLPFITVGSTSPRVPLQAGPTVFLACFGDNVQASVGAEYASSKFGKTAYLLSNRGAEYTKLLASYFKSRFTELGGRILLEDSYENAVRDFSPQIARLKALPVQPAFYYISAMPYEVVEMVKQFRAAGFDHPIVGGDGYDIPDLGQMNPPANGIFFTTHAMMDMVQATPGIKKFIADYTTQYGIQPENAFAALGYDSLYLMVDAIKRANSTNSAAIVKALEHTQHFEGITGSITFSPQSHVPLKTVTVIEVKDGKFVLAAQQEPSRVPPP